MGTARIGGKQDQAALTPLQRFDPDPRQKRQFDQLVDYTQKLLPGRQSNAARNSSGRSSTPRRSSKFEKSQEPLRDYFWKEVIGKLPEPTMPLNPRTRLIYETPKWKGYEVVLDLYADVFGYGILLVPKDLKPGEKRPVVVCQHGLEGRPTDVVNPEGEDAVLQLVRRPARRPRLHRLRAAEPVHRQERVPPGRPQGQPAEAVAVLVHRPPARAHPRLARARCRSSMPAASPSTACPTAARWRCACRRCSARYCLSICSGDFNEWIWKNITLDWAGSYMFTGEYEMYEFDLGNTFNYAEMAALIAPRPFMVERGHDDGVGLDE